MTRFEREESLVIQIQKLDGFTATRSKFILSCYRAPADVIHFPIAKQQSIAKPILLEVDIQIGRRDHIMLRK